MTMLQTLEGNAPPVVGVLGGGQLGRMMAYAAHRLGIELVILDPQGKDSPAGQIGVQAIAGSFTKEEDIALLAEKCDIITVEIEHVNAAFLSKLQASSPKLQIHPSPAAIALIQDKYEQKKFFQQVSGVHVAPFKIVASLEDGAEVGKEFGYPYMLKSRLLAYDGKGNAIISNEKDLPEAFSKLGVKEGQAIKLYAEKWVPFTKELAVMVAKSNGLVRAYPVVETTQKDSICSTVLAPAQISSEVYAKTKKMALDAISKLQGNGIYGVELFLTAEGEIFLNEIAPRPHNSGHYTIEACETDQFEQHLRAIVQLPLGGCDLRVGASLMVNVLGSWDASEATTYDLVRKSMSVPGATPHFYGKAGGVRPGRKLAHFTVVGSSLSELTERLNAISPEIAVDAGLIRPSNAPLVGIVMGSDSDLPTMAAAAEMLEKFSVPYELTIVSAHRTPARMYKYAQTAVQRGLKVIVAGAGGAAHLPGMIAALTALPVIGVPVKTSTLNGQDSLLSIVQMPRGVPVATVAIGNSTNAGLLAVRMLGDVYVTKMEQFLLEQKEEVDDKIEHMANQGWKTYLQNMKH
jgi:phosphoribosylaminoimidazole carboxylase